MKTLEQLGISPAPWNEKVWATSDDYGHDISDYNHKSICDMRLLQGETRIPNARLIAAAPKLYDAGQKTEAVLTRLFKLDEFAALLKSGAADALIACRDELRKALAKAAGESEVKDEY